MTYEEIHALGNCLDDVYNNTALDGSKKINSKLDNNILTLTYQTIVHISRDQGMHIQTPRLKDESSQMINNRLALIKKEFKECCNRTLKTNVLKTDDFLETITTNPYTPRRIMKYSLSVSYEIE